MRTSACHRIASGDAAAHGIHETRPAPPMWTEGQGAHGTRHLRRGPRGIPRRGQGVRQAVRDEREARAVGCRRRDRPRDHARRGRVRHLGLSGPRGVRRSRDAAGLPLPRDRQRRDHPRRCRFARRRPRHPGRSRNPVHRAHGHAGAEGEVAPRHGDRRDPRRARDDRARCGKRPARREDHREASRGRLHRQRREDVHLERQDGRRDRDVRQDRRGQQGRCVQPAADRERHGGLRPRQEAPQDGLPRP